MRSSARDGGEGDDPFACFYWWRSLPEFADGGGQAFPPKGSELTPRLRVLKEMERLAAAAPEHLDRLRHQLHTYKAGDLWFPAGGVSRADTDIPPLITILLLGFAATGKSSLVNLMYLVLGRSVILPFAGDSTPGEEGRTQLLEEHNVLRSMKSGFCVFDSRGLDYDRLAEGLDEAADWMVDGVRHRQPCRGAGSIDGGPAASSFARRHVGCVMLVVSVSEIYRSILARDSSRLEATKQLFQAHSIRNNCNDRPILVLTHGDELTAEERVEGRTKICEFLGLSEVAGVYDIPCIVEHGGEAMDVVDPVTAYALAEAVYRALVVADRYHPPKPRFRDWLAMLLLWVMSALSVAFAFLAECCAKFAKRDHGRLKLD